MQKIYANAVRSCFAPGNNKLTEVISISTIEMETLSRRFWEVNIAFQVQGRGECCRVARCQHLAFMQFFDIGKSEEIVDIFIDDIPSSSSKYRNESNREILTINHKVIEIIFFRY